MIHSFHKAFSVKVKLMISFLLACLFVCQPMYASEEYSNSSDGVISAVATISAPSNLTAIATSSTQIMLGWKDNSTNETGFKIERKTGNCSSANSWVQVAAKPANATFHTMSGLIPNTAYAFRIRAYQSSTNSTYSNCAFAKAGASGTPPSPTNFIATSVSSTKVNLSWRDNSANETGFKIYRKAGAGPWTLRATTGANIKIFSDTTAINNHSSLSYQYFIIACNGSGSSPSTYAVAVPFQPTNLKATQGTNTSSIQLTWSDKSANEAGFEIYRKSGICSSTSTWAKVVTLGANKTSWTNAGLASGSKYSYKIRAYCKMGTVAPVYGYSLWSACITGYCSGGQSTFRLPDTGQTKCYNGTGEEIPCPQPGEEFYGQDASYSINPQSYTKLDANGNTLPDSAPSWAMVRDNVTGLIWENKTDDGSIHDKDNTYTWYDPNPATNGGDAGTEGDGTDTYDFINSLNAAHFGGFNDWRLPTIMEMCTIVNFGAYAPAINTAYFSNTGSDWYWSSTTGASYTDYAWVMNFYNDPGNYYDKDYDGYVRAVRGGQAGSLDHWVINGDNTVTDTHTGLMWQQVAPDSQMTWEQALSYCENLNLAGHGDWRLPNLNELRSLVDYSRFSPAIDETFFPDTNTAFWYWSSTTDAYGTYGTGYAWGMDVYDGHDDYNGKINDGDVRAVRGGQ